VSFIFSAAHLLGQPLAGRTISEQVKPRLSQVPLMEQETFQALTLLNPVVLPRQSAFQVQVRSSDPI
jgi:hypothetical protein